MTEGDFLLRLNDFFPYRLANLQSAVSAAVGQRYREPFLLGHHEWRVMATLAECPGWSAREVAEHANLEKMQVSRAVARLSKRQLVEQAADGGDRRRISLRLSETGYRHYKQIVPRVLAVEAELLEVLSEEERQQFHHLMDRLLARSRALLEETLNPAR
ncbi:MAG TPA: MarR family winged helix-turn-helix transcriptional regulator [Halomonas sp.]|nr:MarR family winged helix-turn-helix transcriptional regulator [Halomonas sp.]